MIWISVRILDPDPARINYSLISARTEVVQLIRPWFTRAGALQGPTQIAAALYPIEHSLAGPMDVVMSTGFNRMEEDSDDILERHKERAI